MRHLHRTRFQALRVATLTLLLILAFGLPLGTSGCTTSDQTVESTAPVIAKSNDLLSETELVQIMTEAIDERIPLDTAYRSIPEAQRDKLTEDEFQSYIRFLRRGVMDRVISFIAMNDETLRSIQEQIVASQPAQRDLALRTRGYWLNIGNERVILEQFAFYYQIDKDNNAYLDHNWISQLLQLSDFCRLYFDALDTRDAVAFNELLRPTILDDKARLAISSSLNSFYQFNVDTASNEFRMLTARIDGVTFDEGLTVGIGPNGSKTRTIGFSLNTDDQVIVDDRLPSELNQIDSEVYLDDNLLIRVGGDPNASFYTTNSSTLERRIGKPDFHDDTNCTIQPDGQSLIRLIYDGIELTISGECQNHYYWKGHVISATITSPKFRLGSGLRTGNPADKLYESYPFISVGTRAATVITDSGEIELKASIVDQTVNALRLSVG